jgi:hypothetical protein
MTARPRDELELRQPCESCGGFVFRLWGMMLPNSPPPRSIGRGKRQRWPIECVEPSCGQMRLSRDEAVRDRVRALGGLVR